MMTIRSLCPLDGRRATGNSTTKNALPDDDDTRREERGSKIGKGAHRALRRERGRGAAAGLSPGTDYSLAMSKRGFINCRGR